MRANGEELHRGRPPAARFTLEVAGSWGYEKVKLGEGSGCFSSGPCFNWNLLAEVMGVPGCPTPWMRGWLAKWGKPPGLCSLEKP